LTLDRASARTGGRQELTSINRRIRLEEEEEEEEEEVLKNNQHCQHVDRHIFFRKHPPSKLGTRSRTMMVP